MTKPLVNNVLFYSEGSWGYYNITTGATANTIGSGKTNTAKVLAITDTSECNAAHGSIPSIWEWLNDVNSNAYGGCSDWFIGSIAELNALDLSGKMGLFLDRNFWWSSFEYDSDYAYSNDTWDTFTKDIGLGVVAFRAF